MSQNQSLPWLVTYDIAERRRLAQVFKMLKKAGVPVQYSVFSVGASAVTMGQLMVKITQIIHAKEDDVRAYRLPLHGWRAELGESMIPEGTWLV